MAVWLVASAASNFCRLLQYAPLSESAHILVPRVLLSITYPLAWLGYELSNSFIKYRPSRWERTLIITLVFVPVVFLWTGNLILTDQLINRTVAFGGSFKGVQTGSLYSLANLLILVIGIVPILRLLRVSDRHPRENRIMAAGFSFIILFSLSDFIATSLDIVWIRFSDFGYLPVAVLFSYIQVQRFSWLYKDMSILVHERTAKLERSNQALKVEITERKRAEEELLSQAKLVTALYETTNDLIIRNDLTSLLQNIVETATRLLDAGGGGLYLCEPEKNQVRCVVSHNTQQDFSGTVLRYGEGSAGRVAQTGESLIIDDYSSWDGQAEVFQESKPFRAVLSTPIKWKDEIIGILHVLEFSTERKYTADDLAKLTSFANQAAIAIHNARMHDQAQKEILEREQAEQTLRASEERYRLLFEANPHPMWAYDLETLKFLVVNDAAAEHYGYTHDEFLQLTLEDIRPAEELPALMANLAEERRTLEQSGNWKHRKKDGTEIIVEILSHEIIYDERPARLVLANDITARHQAEEGLILSEEKFSVLFDKAPFAVSLSGLHDGVLLDVNEAFEEAFGLSKDEIVGKTSRELGINPYTQERKEILAELSEEEPARNVELALKTKSGEPRVFSVNIDIVTIGNQKYILSAAQDITERKQAEESRKQTLVRLQQEVDVVATIASSENLASGAVHELATEVTEAASRALGIERVGVWLFQDDESRLVNIDNFTASSGEHSSGTILLEREYENEFAALKNAKYVDAHDPLTDPRTTGYVEGYLKPNRITSMLDGVIRSAGNNLGLLCFEHVDKEHYWENDEISFICQLADQIALAISNRDRILAEEKTRQRADEMASLVEVSRDITSSLDLNIVLERIATNAKDLLKADTTAVYLFEQSEATLQAIAAKGLDAIEIMEKPLKLNEGILGDIATKKVGEIVNKISDDPRSLLIRGTEDIPEEHLMAVPVLVNDQLTGMIAVWRSKSGNEFTPPELKFLASLAQQVAVAIENARLFEKTRRRLSEIEAVHTVSTALRSAQNLEEALPIILDQVMVLLNAEGVLVDLLDLSTGDIRTELAYGVWVPISGKSSPRDQSRSNHVITTSQSYITNNLMGEKLITNSDLLGELNSGACIPVIAQNQPIGTLWIGRKTPILDEEIRLLEAIGEMVGNAIHRMRLHQQTETLLEDLQTVNRELIQAYDDTLEGWAKALELRDKETEGHSQRVTGLTLELARQLNIPEDELTHIHRGILLHDIGKMGIPDRILKKPGPLSDEEWAEMRNHPEYAHDLIHQIAFLRPALNIPYSHHERWDGSGYPRGLKGEEIPFAARIFAVVDVWDALIYDRPYRKAWPKKDALDYIREHSGILFDPQVVEKFLDMIDMGSV